ARQRGRQARAARQPKARRRPVRARRGVRGRRALLSAGRGACGLHVGAVRPGADAPRGAGPPRRAGRGAERRRAVSLAVAIVASLAVTMLVALWAARSASRWRAAQTLLVTLAPLAALAWLVTQAPPRGGGYALRVTGQYAPITDTVIVGGAEADVRLTGGGSTRSRVWYDRVARAVRVHIDSGVAPVALGDRPVNAVPIVSGTRVT